MPDVSDISSALTDARWAGRVLRFRTQASPEAVAEALAYEWQAQTFAGERGTYFADAVVAAGLQLLVFRDRWPDYDEYELILIRGPHVDDETAGHAWGGLAGSVWSIHARLRERDVLAPETGAS